MLLLLLFILLAVLIVHQFYYRRRNLPNGPLPLPIIGNAHLFLKKERWEDQFLKWREEFGPIYTYWLGPMAIVSVNDYQIIQKMFVHDGDTYADRAAMEAFDDLTRGGVYGVIETSGNLWSQQRRFALKVLRDFGLGKNKMQERILDELLEIRENIDAEIKSGAKEIDFHRHTDIATGSVINAVVCGFRFTEKDHQHHFYRLREVTEKMMKNFSDPLLNLAVSNPTISKLPVFSQIMERAGKVSRPIFEFLNHMIDEHLKLNDYTDDNFEPQDFIDAYLLEQNRQEKQKNKDHYFTRQQLLNVLFDLWFAGQETTSTTLTWGFAYLIRHPEAQQKLHAELDRVIGSDRLITMSDKNDLPYTNAVINEIQRCSNIVGQNLPRKTTREVVIANCKLPKGTVVIPQVSVLMNDPKIFPEPKKFNPDRFIDENGKLKRCDELMPFSIGKRQCLGEGIARAELFLFLANLCNAYKFYAGEKEPTLLKLNGGGSLSTKPYKTQVVRRH
ncbi:(pine wood nematode) hypothetical protein [Aphelenchoides besseyi]|nr:(pine wood nematode) hypothetical protein [Aphelenchoides besseyi]